MKTIRVVAAVICDSMQEKRKIYATARGYGDYKGQWEFPGGKIEPGETPQQALLRFPASEPVAGFHPARFCRPETPIDPCSHHNRGR